MALFRLPSSGPAALMPRGHGLLLRAPQMSDFPQWTQLREFSRAYLTPWEPIWPSDDLTRAGFRRRLRRYAEDVAADRSYPFIIFRESDGMMIGGITLANVRRGIVQAGTIGYWVGQPHSHRGHMTTALRVLLPSLFGELNLHRIEAACIPSNAPSIRVLEKCGFTREGLARRYLCINGSLAGPFAVRPAARGFQGVKPPFDALLDALFVALGSPPLPCYKPRLRINVK